MIGKYENNVMQDIFCKVKNHYSPTIFRFAFCRKMVYQDISYWKVSGSY